MELSYSQTQNLERHIAKLGTIGVQLDGSITRLAFSDAESAAMAYVRAEGEAFGLEGHYDGIGNLLLSTPGQFQRRLLVGSHLDSVHHGGNYDGSAGVVAALEALREICRENRELSAGIDLVAWRGEEYTFHAVYKGSAAAFGLSDPHVLHNLYGDQTLRDAILQQGFDPSYIDECRPSFDPAYIDSLAGYIELHIEQGARLEQERRDLGLVTSIAGDRRFLVVLEGRFDHSGATPMGVRYRSDVNLAMAYIQTGLDQLARQRREQGREFTQTVGIVNADPEIDKKYPNIHSNSFTKVSGLGYFSLDIMGSDDAFLDDYSAEVHRLVWRTANEFGVTAFIEQTDHTPALSELDAQITGAMESAAEHQGHSTLRMASGAGHDAVMVARAEKTSGGRIPVGMLFVPCRHGLSHCPQEHVSPEQLGKGVDVLRGALLELVGAG
jgi:N-carbamoyl-L-amino-acid hydrolase